MTLTSISMQAVAVGTFQYQDVSTLGRLNTAQQWITRRAQVAGKNDTGAATPNCIVDIALDVRRAKQVACAL
ncbi:hypothetical protein D3C77_682930 [compost metagenome]